MAEEEKKGSVASGSKTKAVKADDLSVDSVTIQMIEKARAEGIETIFDRGYIDHPLDQYSLAQRNLNLSALQRQMELLLGLIME